MSTAGFTTKDEEVKVEYVRIDDSYVPQERDPPLIKPLLRLKLLFLVATILYTLLLKFALNTNLNIDSVWFIKRIWEKQLITDFKAVPQLFTEKALAQKSPTQSEPAFSYPYPGFDSGCDCRDPQKTKSQKCQLENFYGKILKGECSESMKDCECSEVRNSQAQLLVQSDDLNPIYAQRIVKGEYDTSYLNLFGKMGQDYKCQSGFSMIGQKESPGGDYGVCVDNKLLQFENPVTIAKFGLVNSNPDYTGHLVGKKTDFWWGSIFSQLPIVELNLEGGSFCQGKSAQLFSDWPLFEPSTFFSTAKEANYHAEDDSSGGNPNCPDKQNETSVATLETGEMNFFQANLLQPQEFKMSLTSSNSVKYSRSFVKLIVFDPKCQDEFNSIVQEKGPRSIQGL